MQPTDQLYIKIHSVKIFWELTIHVKEKFILIQSGSVNRRGKAFRRINDG